MRLLATLFSLIVLFGCQNNRLKDMPPVPEAKLLAVAPDLVIKGSTEPINNGLRELTDLGQSFDKQIGTLLAKKLHELTPEERRSILDLNKRTVVEVEKLIAQPWWFPEPNLNNLYPEFANFKLVIKVLAKGGECAAEAGDERVAVRSFTLARQMNRKLSERSNTILSLLVAFAGTSITERAIRETVVNRKFGVDSLAKLEDSSFEHEVEVGLKVSAKGEWMTFVNAISILPKITEKEIIQLSRVMHFAKTTENGEAWLEGYRGHQNPFDRVETVSIAAEIFREFGEGNRTEKLRWDLTDGVLNYLPADDDESLPVVGYGDWVRKTSNPLGKLLVFNLMPSLGQVSNSIENFRFQSRATNIVVGCAIYEARFGRLPHHLAELKLKSSLNDPYRNGLLQFDPKRGIAWSVGPDGKDDGGNDPPERFQGAKDRVVRLK